MAARIDTQTEYLSRASNVPSSTSFTIAFWAYIVSNLGAGTAQGLCGLFGSGSTDSIFFLWNDSGSGAMSAGVFKASPFGVDIATPASRPATGTWAYYFMRRSGTASNTFTAGWAAQTSTSFTSANGALIAGTTPGTLSVDTIRIGSTNDATIAANARYAGVKVWDASLTDAELLIERNSYWPARTANINSFFPMLDPTAANLGLDMSTNARNLTITGTLTVEDNPPGIRRDRRWAWTS